LTEFLEIWREQRVVVDGPSRVLLTPSKYCVQFYDARQTCGMGIPLQALTVQSIEVFFFKKVNLAWRLARCFDLCECWVPLNIKLAREKLYGDMPILHET
jgi:hypothetical protein